MRFQRKQCQAGSTYTKRYPDEYQRDAIGLVRSSGRTATEAAREPGTSPQSLQGRVNKARAAQGAGSAPGAARHQPGAVDRDQEPKRLQKPTAGQAKTTEIPKKRPPSLRRRATGKRDIPVHPSKEGQLHAHAAAPRRRRRPARRTTPNLAVSLGDG
ncbi:transposase [Streptomyces sp. NBC_01615]|uniref:transposase n=1 Tax=Streptomyces sp. NBC_01615 TaxID=2975898 RepID=UPI00386774E6